MKAPHNLTPIGPCVVFLLSGMFLSGSTSTATMVRPVLEPARKGEWVEARGDWRIADGCLEQTRTDRAGVAILKSPAFSEATISFEFNVVPEGPGVRAAAVCFRATGTMTYYWLHLDTRHNGVILVRSTPTNTWNEMARTRHPLPEDAWNAVCVSCEGPRFSITINDTAVLTAEDDTIPAGCVGFGTSQGHAKFRNITIEGKVEPMSEPLKNEEPPYKIISRGDAAGTYQAFPDACRLQNGDIIAVFYAGYGHVSLPNDDWPKGGRICSVRSSDEGRTWTDPVIVYDDKIDNRDPHIAQMSDGSLICTFFSLKPTTGGRGFTAMGVQTVRSTDGGKTWDEKARTIATDWVCSAPVREMPDGTYILGVYHGHECGGVIRSTDQGKTWSAPIPIGRESGLPLDAETDVILLQDGTLYAALRSSKINMHYATSNDLGLTWSPVKDIGFKGHAPHLYRLSTGTIVLTHRVPATAMHVSRDECKTWEGPYQIDTVGGAYPATVELRDGSIMVIYYEEGSGSAVRVRRFSLDEDGLTSLEW